MEKEIISINEPRQLELGEKLSNIQFEFKAQKSNFNAFGKSKLPIGPIADETVCVCGLTFLTYESGNGGGVAIYCGIYRKFSGLYTNAVAALLKNRV